MARIFAKPGTIDESEEDEFGRSDDVKFKIGGDSPLLTRGFTPLSGGVPSLARISTCNSSLTHVPGFRQDGSR
ncbi:hypothetical protein TcasGA2_TC001198 [Tribolium castaneum]|uniref:Uncharacterized protein n=2 Tax=Tribolium castaneum TaxID=7070 RepID=D6WAQ2_TRICA|nr:hypothetical protein TcasGA2_TC001198 [Tribolium castaneum]